MRKGKQMDKKTLGEKKQLFKFKSVFKNKKDLVKTTDKQLDGVSKNGKKPKNKKLGWKIFKIFLFTMIALFIIGTGIVVGVISGVIDKTNSINLQDLQMLKLTTFIYDKDGNEIGSIYGENRVTVSYSDLPQTLIDAVTSIEDERFFSHGGVDIKRTLGAVVTYVFNGGKSTFGGSTITQQLVKNVTQDNSTTWTRKIREWYRAISLEHILNKQQILETYLNTIYLGDGSYGVEVASKDFFGKTVKELNLAESAVIAADIQSPEATNPYKDDEARQKLLDRQKLVLQQMLKLNKITQAQYDEAINYKIEFKKASALEDGTVQSWFVDAVLEQVIDDIQTQKNVDRGVAIKMLYSDGYKIYSTEDPKVQKAIDDAYNNDKLFYTNKDGTFMQSSMVVMDQTTGNVLGLMGGADKKTGSMVWNWATQEKRQPGSTMKLLGAYGPAFEEGVSYPAMGIDDSQFTLGNWTPGNYYGYFNGYVTAREAIMKSMNIPAVRTTQKAGVDYAFNFAKNAGLVDLVDQDKNLASMALGGVTNGFTVLEMANAYSTIANGGVHLTPKLYTKVVDKDGNDVLTVDTTAKRVMKATTAYLLTDCLRSVVTGGTAAGYVKVGNMPVVGKTGNTNDDFDQWFIGYSPYYTIAVWNGYDQKLKKPIGYRKIGSYPYTSIVLFNTVMNAISKDLPVKQFDKPDGIVTASVDRDSGLAPTDATRLDPRGDRTITDIFASGTVPTQTDNVHVLAKICTETGLLATQYCPSTVTKSFITRDYVPGVKPRDWQFMLPTQYCNIHTSAQSIPTEENPPGGEVDIYPPKQ